MSSVTTCVDCGEEPRHPGSVVRLVGKDASGNTVALCSRCFIRRERDAQIPEPTTTKTKRKAK
jgi:hypothetical protein